MADEGRPDSVVAAFGMPLTGPPATDSPAVLAVGNFDGVHLGHQRLLAAARRMAGDQGVVVAVTFEPHPSHLLRPAAVPGLLTPLQMRRRLLSRVGVDAIQVVPFNDRLRAMEPDEFLDRLRHRYPVIGLVGGPRLSLGRAGTGGIDFVRRYARDQRLRLEVVNPVRVGETEVSSTQLRRLLQEGRVEEYPGFTGAPFEAMGEVVAGDGLGRGLGFPTANIQTLPAQLLPPDGVYVMTWRRAAGQPQPAVGSIGLRPHFQGRDRRFEVHGLGPTPELYGADVTVAVLRRLRGQMAFGSDSDLVRQMETDRRAAEDFFAGAGS